MSTTEKDLLARIRERRSLLARIQERRELLRGPAPGAEELAAGERLTPDRDFTPQASREAVRPTEPEDVGPLGEFTRGVRTGARTFQTSAGEAFEQTGTLVGSDRLEELGENISDAGREAQGRSRGRVQNFSDVQSADDFVDWAAFSLGQGLASTAAPVAGGLAGGAVAGPAGAAVGSLVLCCQSV